MLVGNKVYLSSTLTGDSFIYRNRGQGTFRPEVGYAIQVALGRCMTEYGESHSRGASCGETLVAQMFAADQPDVDLSQADDTLSTSSLARQVSPESVAYRSVT